MTMNCQIAGEHDIILADFVIEFSFFFYLTGYLSSVSQPLGHAWGRPGREVTVSERVSFLMVSPGMRSRKHSGLPPAASAMSAFSPASVSIPLNTMKGKTNFISKAST